jgi:uncharacterized membrane protein
MGSFYIMARRFLAKTYFESFELRAKYKRRSEDHVMTIGDRVFMIQDGIVRLIDDFLKHVKYQRKDPSHNPVFNRIFGTFLGIMKALPELTAMDITDAIASKAVIDSFLIKFSFPLSTSILGIILSIAMSFLNTLLSPESTYVEMIDSFKAAAEILWNKFEDNDLSNLGFSGTEGEVDAEKAFEVAIANMYSKKI